IASNPTHRLQRPFGGIFFRSGIFRRDVLEREHLLNGRPVCVLNVGMMMIVFGLPWRRPTDHLSLSKDFNLPAEFTRLVLDATDLVHNPIERSHTVRVLCCTGESKTQRPG